VDNLTHTLAGMLVAEAACATRRDERASFRTAAYLVSALANNLPDIDPIYTFITRPRPLGSLLHHRGHTHTLLFALPAGFLLALAILWVMRRRLADFTSRDRRWVLGLGTFGAALHITMDSGNSYGVHPFWPFFKGWVYGDSIFIVEPLWWAIALPSLAFAVTTRWLRIALLGALALVFTVAAFLPFIGKATVVALGVVALGASAAAYFGSARIRIATAWSGCLAVALTFVVASANAKSVLRAAMQTDAPSFRIHDVAATPLPGNPLCWTALVVGTDGPEYAVESALVAPFPRLAAAAACPYDASARPTARFADVPHEKRDDVRWFGRYRTSLRDFRALVRRDCRVRALLGFARVPYTTGEVPLRIGTDPPRVVAARIAGDLRYDRSPGLDFADLALMKPYDCPSFVPSWTPPRNDLFPADD
jgi:inner membrane protein